MKNKINKVVDIIGAPISLASPQKGASLGPDSIRIAGLKEILTRLELNFNDLGNIFSLEEPYPPKNFERGEIRYLEEVYGFLLELKNKVLSSLENGNFPLILGGDHSLAIGSMAAVTNYYKTLGEKPSLIWFDAHGDFNTHETSESGNIHGMPMALAHSFGHEKLLSLFENSFFDPSRTVLIGARSIDSLEGELINKIGLKTITMKDIDENGMKNCVHEAIKIISPNNNPVHLSFDIDGVDLNYAPGTGTPVWGGVTLREAHLLLETLSAECNLCSMDMVEVNPILDVQNKTAMIAKSLIASALGKVIY